MQRKEPIPSILAALALLVLIPAPADGVPTDSNRGLWVGEVTLRYVNEVSVPLDRNNNPVAPRPTIPTPTADAANLRLILHVNGAGQVSLLNEVALLARRPDLLRSDNDLALVTDERLYGEFPPQAAKRIASAAFDFGDAQATAAVTAVVEEAVRVAYQEAATLSLEDVDTVAERAAQIERISNIANQSDAVPAIIPTADAAAAFNRFLTTHFNTSTVNDIAEDLAPGANVDSVVGSLRDLADDVEETFYGDTRARDLIEAIVDGVDGVSDETERQAIAQALTSSFADLTNNYQRFIAGKLFGDMITGAAEAAAEAAKSERPVAVEAYTGLTAGLPPTQITSTGHQLEIGDAIFLSGSSADGYNGPLVVNSVVDENNFVVDVPYVEVPAGDALGGWVRSGSVSDALDTAAAVRAAKTEALRIEVPAYEDHRATTAIEIVIAALEEAALTAAFELPAADADLRLAIIRSAAEEGAREALEESVPRYEVPIGTPSTDYTAFVRSDAYQGSAETAAHAAADAAVFEVANNILATERSIKAKARAAAIEALDPVFSAAARVSQTGVPVLPGAAGGGFGAGLGDPRLTAEIAEGDPPLGSPALEATIILAANHPTNPFRHRRHPDHTVGFDVTRKICLDFDAADLAPHPRAGFGVERLTGIYREEILGLHKPLGPEPETKPIGFRVEGTFELQRVSFIDTLNAR